MKEMIYGPERKEEMLYSGVFKGVEFAIINLGTHPTAYIKLNGLSDYSDNKLNDIIVHGDFSYYNKPYWNKRDKDMWLGWDYAHCDDYIGWYDEVPGLGKGLKKWTTQEIYFEVCCVIDQVVQKIIIR